MARTKFRIKLGIGAKLGLAIAIGVLIVAGMGLADHVSSRLQANLVTAADKQKTIIVESSKAKILLQAAQIAGRDIRQAKARDQVDAQLRQLDIVSEQANVQFKVLTALVADVDTRAKIGRTSVLALAYTAALGDLATKQIEILDAFQALDEAERKWTQQFNRLVNSDTFAAMPNGNAIEAFLNESGSAFKDARASTWRYFVLSEESQVIRITAAADQAVAKLQYARRDVQEPKILTEIDGLSALVSDYIGALRVITNAINTQLKIQSEQANPAEQGAQSLLNEVADSAAAFSQEATAEVVTGSIATDRRRIAAAVGVAVLFFGIALFASKTMARPMRHIAQLLMQLANGRTNVTIPYIDRYDEIGDTARASSVFRDNLLRMAEIESREKEVEVRVRAERISEMNRLADTFDKTIGEIVNSVSSTSSDLEVAASTLTNNANATRQLAHDVAEAAEQTSDNVRSVSDATEQVSEATFEISQQSQQSDNIAREAVTQAQATNARMATLLNVSNRIGEVVDLIAAIAAQTNLLALNATIEAARAGEAGRGFAVVASEVKSLAKRTTDATEEIRSHVEAIQGASEQSVLSLKDIRETISRLADAASTIASAVHEQSATTRDISDNVKHAAARTSEMVAGMIELNKGASQTGAASADLLSSAQKLTRESIRLKAEAQQFLVTVRRAG